VGVGAGVTRSRSARPREVPPGMGGGCRLRRPGGITARRPRQGPRVTGVGAGQVFIAHERSDATTGRADPPGATHQPPTPTREGIVRAQPNSDRHVAGAFAVPAQLQGVRDLHVSDVVDALEPTSRSSGERPTRSASRPGHASLRVSARWRSSASGSHSRRSAPRVATAARFSDHRGLEQRAEHCAAARRRGRARGVRGLAGLRTERLRAARSRPVRIGPGRAGRDYSRRSTLTRHLPASDRRRLYGAAYDSDPGR
jgi:hypothetical protein